MIRVSNGNKDKKWGWGNNRAALSSLPLRAWSYKILSGLHCCLGQDLARFCTPGGGLIISWTHSLHQREIFSPVNVKPFLPQACPNNLRGTPQMYFLSSDNHDEQESPNQPLALTFPSENTCVLSLLLCIFLWLEFWVTRDGREVHRIQLPETLLGSWAATYLHYSLTGNISKVLSLSKEMKYKFFPFH